MKPAPFDYHRPATLDEALHLLARRHGDARILAGGQSLVPMMNLRLARPAVLVDINRIPGLDYHRRTAMCCASARWPAMPRWPHQRWRANARR